MFDASILLPTARDRFIDCIRTWDDDGIEFVISYELNNPDLYRLTEADRASFRGTFIETEHRGNVIQAWNHCAELATTNVMQVIDDDLNLISKNWREIIVKHLPKFPEGIWAVVGNNNLVWRGKNTWQRELASHPCITRGYYNLFGYAWNPDFDNQCADVEFFIVGNGIGRLLYIPEFEYEHRHPISGKNQRDKWNEESEKEISRDEKIKWQRDRMKILIEEKKKQLNTQ